MAVHADVPDVDRLALAVAQFALRQVPGLFLREEKILQLLAQGMENKEIAAYLVVRDATVRTHVSNILRKLQLANRVQATLYALRTGISSLVDEPPDLR